MLENESINETAEGSQKELSRTVRFHVGPSTYGQGRFWIVLPCRWLGASLGIWRRHIRIDNDLRSPHSMSLSRVKFVAETLIYVQNFLSSCYAKLKPCGGRSKPLLPTSKYQPESKAYTATKHAIGASFVVGILLIPVFLLLWIRMSRLWTSFTVSFSMLIFAFVMGSFSRVKTQDVLIGTAG